MHFSALAVVATGLMSALSGVSAHQADGVAHLGARSSKQILALALRSIDNDEADNIVARYYSEALAKRDFGDELVSNLVTRASCPYCGAEYAIQSGAMADHVASAHKSNSRKPAKKGRK